MKMSNVNDSPGDQSYWAQFMCDLDTFGVRYDGVELDEAEDLSCSQDDEDYSDYVAADVTNLFSYVYEGKEYRCDTFDVDKALDDDSLFPHLDGASVPTREDFRTLLKSQKSGWLK